MGRKVMRERKGIWFAFIAASQESATRRRHDGRMEGMLKIELRGGTGLRDGVCVLCVCFRHDRVSRQGYRLWRRRQ